MQVKLEDVFPMAAGQHMGSPFSHSAHIYQSRFVLSLSLYPTLTFTFSHSVHIYQSRLVLSLSLYPTLTFTFSHTVHVYQSTLVHAFPFYYFVFPSD